MIYWWGEGGGEGGGGWESALNRAVPCLSTSRGSEAHCCLLIREGDSVGCTCKYLEGGFKIKKGDMCVSICSNRSLLS